MDKLVSEKCKENAPIERLKQVEPISAKLHSNKSQTSPRSALPMTCAANRIKLSNFVH